MGNLNLNQNIRIQMSNVDENIFLARVAEQAERFEDMVDFLSQVLDTKGGEVNSDERNLLSVAFKNLISSKRAACRTIAAIEQNPKYSKFQGALTTYKTTIEQQLTEDCNKIIDIINTKVLSKECGNEAKAFFVKMVGDYYRYIADNALQEALDKIDELEEDDFRDAKSIIELLKENLTLWKEEENDGAEQIDDL